MTSDLSVVNAKTQRRKDAEKAARRNRINRIQLNSKNTTTDRWARRRAFGGKKRPVKTEDSRKTHSKRPVSTPLYAFERLKSGGGGVSLK